jgi:hypothetical protein
MAFPIVGLRKRMAVRGAGRPVERVQRRQEAEDGRLRRNPILDGKAELRMVLDIGSVLGRQVVELKPSTVKFVPVSFERRNEGSRDIQPRYSISDNIP